MTGPERDEQARRLAVESLAAGDPTGWFERLYLVAEDGEVPVPWDRESPHQLLVEWARVRELDGRGRRALVVGCGLGRDAEYLAGFGFDTTAFDISETAVEVARRRHPDSAVRYVAADLFDPPHDWREGFDLVVESMTVQALPDSHRLNAIVHVGQMVGPGGTLIVIAAAREKRDPVDPPPWPLTRAEIDAFATDGLAPVLIEDVRDAADPTVRRWRAEFHRPPA
jgi:SAM-dependent methyltransferase